MSNSSLCVQFKLQCICWMFLINDVWGVVFGFMTLKEASRACVSRRMTRLAKAHVFVFPPLHVLQKCFTGLRRHLADVDALLLPPRPDNSERFVVVLLLREMVNRGLFITKGGVFELFGKKLRLGAWQYSQKMSMKRKWRQPCPRPKKRRCVYKEKFNTSNIYL